MLAVAAKVVFGLILGNVSANQKHPKPIIALFHAVITLMAKVVILATIQPSSPNYLPAFTELNSGISQSVLHNVLYRRC